MSMNRITTLVGLELRQRVRSVAWYVLLGVYGLVLVGVIILAFLGFNDEDDSGGYVYSVVVFVTLLLAVLVSPALTGNAINGDRESATLAPVQVTLATTGEIVTAKFLAGWISGLAFAIVAVPFMVIASFAGGVSAPVVLVSLAVLVVEIGVIAALGVAFSGIIARPLFSVACTYLVVAALVVGTLIAFGLSGLALRSTVHAEQRWAQYDDAGAVVGCEPWESYTSQVPRYDKVWGTLAVNPFVILADAAPVRFTPAGDPTDLFGDVKYGIRSVQIAPEPSTRFDECSPGAEEAQRTPSAAEVVSQTTPSWFVGLAFQVVLAGLLLWWAFARTRTPARRLPPGTRIA